MQQEHVKVPSSGPPPKRDSGCLASRPRHADRGGSRGQASFPHISTLYIDIYRHRSFSLSPSAIITVNFSITSTNNTRYNGNIIGFRSKPPWILPKAFTTCTTFTSLPGRANSPPTTFSRGLEAKPSPQHWCTVDIVTELCEFDRKANSGPRKWPLEMGCEKG